MSQDLLMLFCPATGQSTPYPSHAAQWRKHNGATAWLFNPWSGNRRAAQDVGSDTFGMAMVAETAQVLSQFQQNANAQQAQQAQGRIFGAGMREGCTTRVQGVGEL